MSRVAGIVYLQSKISFRNWWVYVAVGILPASYYLVFHLLGGAALSDQVLFGSLIALSLNVGVVSLPQFLVLAKMRKLQEMYVASPVRPIEYMLGFAIARLLFSLPGLAGVLALLLALHLISLSMLPSVLTVLVGTWLVGSMLGFTLGTYVTNLSVVGSLSNMVGFVLMLIPPVLYPATLISGTWRNAALAVPSSSAALLLRAIAGVQAATASEVWYCVGVLGFYTLACALLVVYKSRWREA